jgi:hypothetical protein
MREQRGTLERALDPLAEDGAMSRFIRSLREELQTADEDRGQRLDRALGALDANDETSLISRLARETERARAELVRAVNPDAEGSPMATIKRTLTALLKEQATTQAEALRAQQARQVAFEKEVREVLARLETKRTQDQKSTRGGFDFEDAVVGFVGQAVAGAPVVFEVTGNTVGLVDRSKRGDAVARFTSESAFDGAAVVFEAKRDAAYTAQKALTELDEACGNRGAQVGVFVMAASHASEAFPLFSRHGSRVLVVWDDKDPATDARLHAAVMLGMALVARTQSVADEGDITAMRDIEDHIQRELERLTAMEKSSQAIRNHAEKISGEILKAGKSLTKLLDKATSTLRALNVELPDEAVERASPVALPNDSLERAVEGLGAAADAAE